MAQPRSHGGQSFLALILLVGIVVIGIGLTLVFLVTSAIGNVYGYQSSVRARAVAASGADDALLQLARNVQFSNTSGYTVGVGSNAATVTVTQNAASGTVTILSTATVSQSTQKVQVIVATNATTSQVSVLSWTATQ